MSGKKSRDLGYYAERKVVKRFKTEGYDTERVPLSGAVKGGSFEGDVRVNVTGRYLSLEVKRRKNNKGYAFIVDSLKDRDALVLHQDGKDGIICLTLTTFFDLVRRATEGLGRPLRIPQGQWSPLDVDEDDGPVPDFGDKIAPANDGQTWPYNPKPTFTLTTDPADVTPTTTTDLPATVDGTTPGGQDAGRGHGNRSDGRADGPAACPPDRN